MYTIGPLSNYLRERMDEGFGWLRLSCFEGASGGGPGTSIEARGRFFGSGFTRRSTFFGIWSWDFGFGFIRLKLVASLCSRFRFAWCCFFGITNSSYKLTESSSSESSSSLKQSRSTRSSFCFMIMTCLIHKNTITKCVWKLHLRNMIMNITVVVKVSPPWILTSFLGQIYFGIHLLKQVSWTGEIQGELNLNWQPQ